MDDNLTPLVPLEMYDTHAVHIGTNQKSADMKQFLDEVRQDNSGIHIIDVRQTDSRIRAVAKFLSNYDAERILVVSARQYGQRPARKFAQTIGAMRIVGRFIPGNSNKLSSTNIYRTRSNCCYRSSSRPTSIVRGSKFWTSCCRYMRC
jgi:ribosomal protein uS2